MSRGLRWTEDELQKRGWRKPAVAPPPAATFQDISGRTCPTNGPQIARNAKYGNEPENGEASRRQAKRLRELRMLAGTGAIRGLARQPEYVLVPRQDGADGKLLERRITYIADFQYEERDRRGGWRLVVEDSKGYATRAYVQKRKLMLAIHGIQIRET